MNKPVCVKCGKMMEIKKVGRNLVLDEFCNMIIAFISLKQAGIKVNDPGTAPASLTTSITKSFFKSFLSCCKHFRCTDPNLSGWVQAIKV